MRCLEHMKVIEILRLKEMNLFTYRDIAASVDCSKTTVGEILSRCKKHGLTYADASPESRQSRPQGRPTGRSPHRSDG